MLLLTGMAVGATPRPTVLGVSWEGTTGMLARLDAQTLRPVGRRLDIGKPPTGLAARSPDGRTIALRGRGYGASDVFYEARGSYNLFATCNEWSGARLRKAGVRTGVWTPFAQSIMWRLGDAA